MLKNVDLSREVAKAEYKRLKGDADLELAALQRQVKALGIPVVIVFEGWSAAGKGTLINELILPLDPRGFTVHSASGPTEEEAFYPFLWRVLGRAPTPAAVGPFVRGWKWPGWTGPGDGEGKGKRLPPPLWGYTSSERR